MRANKASYHRGITRGSLNPPLGFCQNSPQLEYENGSGIAMWSKEGGKDAVSIL
jgi:hypothetical protein